MRVKSVVLATLLLVVPAAVSAQNYATLDTERFFRVESEVSQGRRGPVVAGYVHNLYAQTVGNIRLLVEGLDAGGQVTSSTTSWLVGTVRPNGRAYFEARAPQGATSVRVRVLSYEQVARGL